MCCAWKYLQTENCPCPNQAAATWPISPAEAASWEWGGNRRLGRVWLSCKVWSQFEWPTDPRSAKLKQSGSVDLRWTASTQESSVRTKHHLWAQNLQVKAGVLPGDHCSPVLSLQMFIINVQSFFPHLKPYVRVRKIRNTFLITEREIVVLQPLLRRAAKRSRRNKCVVWDVHIEHLLKQLYFIISELAHLHWLDLIDSC